LWDSSRYGDVVGFGSVEDQLGGSLLEEAAQPVDDRGRYLAFPQIV